MNKSLLLVMLLSGCVSITSSDEADLLIGLHERHDRNELTQILDIDPVVTPWCAAYVDYVLELRGYDGTDSLVAKSYLNWGKPVTEPKLWDIVIFDRGTEEWQGHVGFYMGEEDGYYLILGGNQRNQVSVQKYSKNKIVGIRRLD